MRLLVVEDDRDLNRQISAALEGAGYAVDRAFDGEDGWFRGDTEPYDAVVLDIGLPKKDGISVLDAWRKAGRTMPVLILTARDRWSDKVQGIDAGADDDVAKPFHMEEVLARLRALLRRAAGHATSDLLVGPVRLDARSGRVTVNGAAVKLTSHESRLLSYLMHHAGRIISRGEIVEHLYEQDFDRDSNTIEVFIGRLRKKLGVDIIKTARGLGYVVGAEEDEAPARQACGLPSAEWFALAETPDSILLTKSRGRGAAVDACRNRGGRTPGVLRGARIGRARRKGYPVRQEPQPAQQGGRRQRRQDPPRLYVRRGSHALHRQNDDDGRARLCAVSRTLPRPASAFLRRLRARRLWVAPREPGDRGKSRPPSRRGPCARQRSRSVQEARLFRNGSERAAAAVVSRGTGSGIRPGNCDGRGLDAGNRHQSDRARKNHARGGRRVPAD